MKDEGGIMIMLVPMVQYLLCDVLARKVAILPADFVKKFAETHFFVVFNWWLREISTIFHKKSLCLSALDNIAV